MGLFDQALEQGFVAQTMTYGFSNPAEAFAAVTLSAIAADGYLGAEDMNNLILALQRVYLFKSYSGNILQRMIDQLFAVLRQEGADRLFHAAKQSLPVELQESAFAVSADLILAEGRDPRIDRSNESVHWSEQSRLAQLHHALNITDDTAIKIMEVMLIKHRS